MQNFAIRPVTCKRDYTHDLKKRSVSLSRENQTSGLEEIFFDFPPKTRLDFPASFPLSLYLATYRKMRRLLREMKTFRCIFTHGELFNVSDLKIVFFFSISMGKLRKMNFKVKTSSQIFFFFRIGKPVKFENWLFTPRAWKLSVSRLIHGKLIRHWTVVVG